MTSWSTTNQSPSQTRQPPIVVFKEPLKLLLPLNSSTTTVTPHHFLNNLTVDRNPNSVTRPPMAGTGTLKSVVIPVDGSDESMNALRWALANVTVPSPENGGSIILLHVQPLPSIAIGVSPGSIPFGGPSVEVPAFMEAIEAHQKRVTEAVIKHALQICADKNVNVKTQVVVGDPKEKICEVVDENHADLLVMGNRAFGPLKRMFLGSVSKYCSNHASCPVLIVKGESGSKQALQAEGDK